MWPELAAALVVAMVLAGAAVVAVGMMDSERSDAGTANLAAGQLGLSLDVGAVPDQESIAACLVPDFAAGPRQVDVLYGAVQRTADAAVPVLVLRNGSGNLLLCDMFGRDRPAISPQPAATPERPAVPFTTGRRAWDCEGQVWKSFTMNSWLSVTDPVQRAQVRFVVDGRPGEWFTSRASGGYAHLQAWLTDIPAGARVQLEERVLDAEGRPVPSSGLPAQPTDVQPCAGGDVELG